ncbi:MAG: response regulator [Nitrospiraceae bacterium]
MPDRNELKGEVAMDGYGKRVLVVDDNADVRRVVSLLLQSAQYNVFEAGDGLEAVEEIKRRRYDAVLTDYHMPRMDGRQLLASCRTISPTTPVIFVSSEFVDSGETHPEGSPEEAYACLSKPFDARLLLYVVRNAVEQPAMPSPQFENVQDWPYTNMAGAGTPAHRSKEREQTAAA